MNINNHLIIKDNFFDKRIYEEILLDISRLNFTNRNLTVDKEIQSIYQKVYFNVLLNKKHFAVKYVIKKLKEYNLEVTNGNHNYFLSTKHEKNTIHKDKSDLNCFIYIKGQSLMNSGTAFYDKVGDNYNLKTHVGFKENRALIFDSKIYHASTQFEKNCGTRYAMANFFEIKTMKDLKKK